MIEKLQRETIRLSQIQDIAGCRLTVRNVVEQDGVVAVLKKLFPDHVVIDRRRSPSHGYRAVHVIAKIEGKPIEIQIRSTLQHLWAEVSEKLADLVDPGLKYGRGRNKIQTVLLGASQAVADFEKIEAKDIRIRRRKGSSRAVVAYSREGLKKVKLGTIKLLAGIANLSDIIERDDDLSD